MSASGYDDAGTERALERLGASFDFPATPDLAPRVMTAIGDLPGAPRRLVPVPRRVVAVAASILLVVTAVMVASPTLRSAVAERLGIGGVEVGVTEGRVPPDIATRLRLGRSVALHRARAEAPFEVLVPAVLGAPDAVFAGQPVADGVTLAYRARPGLPEVGSTGLGALVMQFLGEFGEEEARESVAQKVVGEGAELVFTEVDGIPAYWIVGDPHTVAFRDERGILREDTTRLAGNVLLFERDGITYRIESDLSLNEALRIASSLR